MQDEKMRHAEIADERDLVLRRGEQMRRFLRPQDFRRMRIEGHDHRRAARFLRVLRRSGNDRLVPEMHAVENADREKERAGQSAPVPAIDAQDAASTIARSGAAHPRDFRQRQDRAENVDRVRRSSFRRP